MAKKAKTAEAIRDLEKQGILKKVTEPTPWISNSVYREKPDGSLRVCIDPSQTINKAIEIPKYPIPTVDELLRKLNKAKVFSCVDVYKGLTNIELDKNSSFLTTNCTPQSSGTVGFVCLWRPLRAGRVSAKTTRSVGRVSWCC